MIKIIRYPVKEEWKNLLRRPASDNASIREKVAEILKAVKQDGDEAVKKFSLQFDFVSLSSFEVTQEEWEKERGCFEQ